MSLTDSFNWQPWPRSLLTALLTLASLRRMEQKEISPSFLGLVATPHKVAKVMGALSPE